MTGFEWPVTLSQGPVTLRPLLVRDEIEYQNLRTQNRDWTSPWDGTLPPGSLDRQLSFRQLIRRFRKEAKAGRMLPWGITLAAGGRHPLVGQMTMSGISYGAASWTMAGYWVSQEFAGRGIAPLALALASDYCFFGRRLHRVEVAIRPENRASLRVVEKLGFRFEGFRPRFMHVAGDWQDHLVYVLHAEEVGSGLVARLLAESG